MAVPKYKASRPRKRHRKAKWMQHAQSARAFCSRCKSPVWPPRVCGVCGYYANRKVIDFEE
jgi:large subunit ribosomal protein L32